MSRDIAASSRFVRKQSGDRATHLAPVLTVVAPAVPGWQDEAACKGQPIELFFPVKGGHPDRSFCDGCPVRQECLDYANDNEGEYRIGLWGGTTPRERQAVSGKQFRVVS